MWNFRTNRRQRGTLLAALVVALFCLLIAGALHLAEARRPQIVVFPAGYQMPANQGPLLERIIPRNWAWAWQLRDKLRGKVKEVFIQGSCFQVNGTPDSLISKLDIGTLLYEKDGIKVWLVQKIDPGTLQTRLRHLDGISETFNGRITTRENSEADLYMGSKVLTASGLTHAGVGLQTFPRVRSEKIDLMTVFTSTEAITNSADLGAQAAMERVSVRTNAVVATRVQMPATASVLILAPRKGSQTNTHIALLLSAEQL